MMTACNGIEEGLAVAPAAMMAEEPQPVNFSAYVNRNTSRGGAVGVVNATTIQTTGFGVFAYYTDGHLYHQLDLPNFMYNQQVTYNTTKWEYTPVKYWPNEVTGNGAEETDRLTFFAYAPYATVNTTTGRVTEANDTTGIVGMSPSTDSGDPVVRYFVDMNPATTVDLCWAAPQKDLTKPAIGEKVTFDFKHALSALNVQIDAAVDATSVETALDSKTRIWVRSITFEGFADRGQLNLNATGTPQWNNLDCDCDLSSQPITINDGRRDGHEGMARSLYERHVALNPVIVQSVAYGASGLTAGVTATAVNLFNSATPTAPIYVIPTNDPLRVTIDYDVETKDDKLITQYLADGVTHGSSIRNSITAYIKDGSSQMITMQSGKQYTLNLHLGMTSVKVETTVAEWGDHTDAPVNLPN